MSRRPYEADWERKKNYLIRSFFHEKPDLSTIHESEELSLSASPPYAAEGGFHEDAGPLPDLIIERVPKRRNEDESESFYCGLRKRMRRYYRMLFNIERDESSSSEFEDFMHCPTFSNKSGSEVDDFEPDLNRGFTEQFEADNTEVNRSNETNHLEAIHSESSHADKSNSSEDGINDEIISAVRKTTEEKENLKSAADMTIGDNTKLHSDMRTDSDSSTTEDNLLETNGKSKSSNGTTKSSLNETAEENSHPTPVIPKNSSTLNARQDTDEMEIMRSNNPSPPTQSLIVNSSSSSPLNDHLERRNVKEKNILSHSLLSDRESTRNEESIGEEISIATRAIGISETSPEEFNPILRSTPIAINFEKRDQNLDRNDSPIFHLSKRRLGTTYTVREYGIEENIRQASIEKANERAAAELIPSAQNVPSNMSETNVPETFGIKEFKEKATQTDDRVTEQAKKLVDIGTQDEKDVRSVHVQTDEDEDTAFFARHRMFRSKTIYVYNNLYIL